MIFKILVAVFFNYKILIRFLISSILCIYLSILIFVSRVFAIARLSFDTSCFKVLVSSCQIIPKSMLGCFDVY